MFEKEEKYKIAFIFYVKATSYEDAQEKMKTLRLEDADEKRVTKFKMVK